MDKEEKIYYTKYRFIQEKYEFKVKDVHNCFLEGQNEKNIAEFLGIYTTQKYLLVVEIQEQTNIIMQHYENKSVYTNMDIKDFLRKHNKVKEITENLFKKKLDNILEVLKC